MYNGSKLNLQNLEKARHKAVTEKVNCSKCEKPFSKAGIGNHEKVCKQCPVCGNYFAKAASTTCSYSCSNTFFRTGPSHGNWSESQYRSTCFHFHDHKCAACDEDIILDVHHMDENRKNNSPENLIPLCPTHHRYWHSVYRYLIEPDVLKYLEDRKTT